MVSRFADVSARPGGTFRPAVAYALARGLGGTGTSPITIANPIAIQRSDHDDVHRPPSCLTGSPCRSWPKGPAFWGPGFPFRLVSYVPPIQPRCLPFNGRGADPRGPATGPRPDAGWGCPPEHTMEEVQPVRGSLLSPRCWTHRPRLRHRSPHTSGTTILESGGPVYDHFVRFCSPSLSPSSIPPFHRCQDLLREPVPCGVHRSGRRGIQRSLPPSRRARGWVSHTIRDTREPSQSHVARSHLSPFAPRTPSHPGNLHFGGLGPLS